MIKHIVMWQLKETAEGNTKSQNGKILKEKLEALIKIIPQIKEIKVGLNGVEAPQSNYDVVLESLFNTYDDLEIYQNHPAHKEVGAFVAKVREARAAVDYETEL